MRLLDLFERCLYAPYVSLDNDADVALEQEGNELYIFLESSDGREDWRNNFDFPAKAYKRQGRTVFFAHRGFLKVWRTVEEYVSFAVSEYDVEGITTVGFSHGGALAVLCHEYVWYHRPDLRERIKGYGFGCPRVIWGAPAADVLARWERFTVVRNLDDAITHLPPKALGYTHVGRMLEIGERGKYSGIDAHRPENIRVELERAGT